MDSLVSLSDHDDIEAAAMLELREECRPVPISVEWTVPWGGTFFHIGVHNLPSGESPCSDVIDLGAYTKGTWQNAGCPTSSEPLRKDLGTLLVFNHANWDENGIGQEAHRAAARDFAGKFKPYLHAFEINGLRPWSENRTVFDLANHFDKPLISGGDRHALEPNTILKMTNAGTFAEFVEEIREGFSDILITNQYLEPLPMRILQSLEDILGDREDHAYGWKHWSDRAFYVCADGVTRSLRQAWGVEPPAVRLFTRGLQMLRQPQFKSAFRMAFAKREAGGPMTPRVAFFTDSYHEINGVALTSREFVSFAARNRYPFFSVRCGPRTGYAKENELETFEIANSGLLLGLERDLSFDLLFYRHRKRIWRKLRDFAPDLIHVTGPSHAGMLGTILAYDLKVPLVASWHTNVHEFAAQRLEPKLPGSAREGVERPLLDLRKGRSLHSTLRFTNWRGFMYAPNPELVEMLAARTGRPAYLMARGIDTRLFSPERRTRRDTDFVIGFVGRLSPEKNVRQLATLERSLLESGIRDCRFLIVGDGSERRWLSQNLQRADFTGVLSGESLYRALTPIWTRSCSLHKPTPLAMWCSKQWLRECPWSSVRGGGPQVPGRLRCETATSRMTRRMFRGGVNRPPVAPVSCGNECRMVRARPQ